MEHTFCKHFFPPFNLTFNELEIYDVLESHMTHGEDELAQLEGISCLAIRTLALCGRLSGWAGRARACNRSIWGIGVSCRRCLIRRKESAREALDEVATESIRLLPEEINGIDGLLRHSEPSGEEHVSTETWLGG